MTHLPLVNIDEYLRKRGKHFLKRYMTNLKYFKHNLCMSWHLCGCIKQLWTDLFTTGVYHSIQPSAWYSLFKQCEILSLTKRHLQTYPSSRINNNVKPPYNLFWQDFTAHFWKTSSTRCNLIGLPTFRIIILWIDQLNVVLSLHQSVSNVWL